MSILDQTGEPQVQIRPDGQRDHLREIVCLPATKPQVGVAGTPRDLIKPLCNDNFAPTVVPGLSPPRNAVWPSIGPAHSARRI